MSDIRKLLDTIEQINESGCGTSVAAGVAPVAMPMGVQKRVEETTDEELPAYARAGLSKKNWANWCKDTPGIPSKKNTVKVKESKKAKPDFPDIDDDNNRKESIKQAAADLKAKKTKPVKEARLKEEDIVLTPGKMRQIDMVKGKGDHEVRMAQNDLQAIVNGAMTIIQVLKTMPEHAPLPGWVQSLISRANDSITDTAQYIQGAAERGEQMLESLSDIDIERKDYERMTPAQFKNAYGIDKSVWFHQHRDLLKPALPGYKDLADLPAGKTLHEDAGAVRMLEQNLHKWASILESQIQDEAESSNDVGLELFDGDESAYAEAVEQLRDKHAGTTIAVICTAILGSLGLYEAKQGLWANIHAKQERIKHGSGERMRKKGEKGYPTDAAIKASQKTSKK